MSNLKFSIKAKSLSSAKTEVSARNFKIIVDEPASLGGTDEGANPVEYVLAALSGCLNVVGHMVAKELGFELLSLSMEIEGVLNPSKLFGEETTIRAGYQQINVKLHPQADTTPELLSKWMKQIEERCPVSDNLQYPTPIIISLS